MNPIQKFLKWLDARAAQAAAYDAHIAGQQAVWGGA